MQKNDIKPKISVSEKKQIINQFRITLAISLIVLLFGAVFYHHVENMSWVNAFYFCTVTLTTIVYGDIVPTTDEGKIFTMFYVLIGIGIIGALVSITVKRSVLIGRNKK